MSNVVYLNRTTTNKNIGYINGIPVENPQTCYEYLLLCKRFLTTEDYENVLHCILDREYYLNAEQQIREVVDRYQEFRV